MSKVSNVLLMLEYLSNGKKYSLQELAERLEVTPRMVRVYKEECEKAGIYIDTIKGPYGGYVLNQNINVPKRFITPKTINNEDKELYNLLSKAIKENNKCLIEYYNKDKSSFTTRIIIPYDLTLLNNSWGIAAYCELKEEIRHFYLNRIKSLKIIKK